MFNYIVEEPEESEDAYEMFAEDPLGERAKSRKSARFFGDQLEKGGRWRPPQTKLQELGKSLKSLKCPCFSKKM